MLKLFCAHTEKSSTLKLFDMNQGAHSTNRMHIPSMGEGQDETFFQEFKRDVTSAQELERQR